jgi:uroporphyrinogen-III synthase
VRAHNPRTWLLSVTSMRRISEIDHAYDRYPSRDDEHVARQKVRSPLVTAAIPPSRSLAGKTIALPEMRELDRLVQLLEDEGATTLRCPMVQMLDAPDPIPVDAWLDRLVAGGFDDLIFLTGEGLRRLLDRATRTGARDAVITALGRVRRITRGPKPARALHEIGLKADLPAVMPTSRGVIESLKAIDIQGRRVGLQLYGQEPNVELVEYLRAAGASVETVAPYVYAPGVDDRRVQDLIAAMDSGRIDAIAFTSASQIDRLWHVAAGAAIAPPALVSVLAKTRVAAIGPIVAGELVKRGVRVDIAPDKPFMMKHLVGMLVEALGAGHS